MIRRRFASIAVRQGLLSAAVVIVAIAIFAGIALSTAERAARDDLLRTIDTDIAGLVDVMAQGGVSELSRRIADRTAFQIEPAAYYLLLAPSGAQLAGNMPRPAMAAPKNSPVIEIATPAGPALARATVLHGGVLLIVGRSLASVTALSHRLRLLYGWTALSIVVISLGVALFAARRMARRIDRMNRTFNAFENGNLAVRVEARDGIDELALLAGHIDDHLARVETLLRAQREISDNIAHELRTPLVHLDARLLDAIERNADAYVGEALYTARGDIRSIVALFDALLDIALAEFEGPSPAVKVFDLSELAADVAELYAASAEELGFDFAARIAPAVSMSGDPMQISRIIANLLDNALRHVPTGSRIRLSVSDGPIIVVEDNGPGIAAQDRDMVFHRFRRRGTAAEGHGLGLALTSSLATRNGLVARIEDASPGARFVIERKAAS